MAICLLALLLNPTFKCFSSVETTTVYDNTPLAQALHTTVTPKTKIEGITIPDKAFF